MLAWFWALKPKFIAFTLIVSLILIFSMIIYVKNYVEERQLQNFRSAQVDEAIRRKDEEIDQIKKDYEELQGINKALSEENEWARFQVSRRETEIKELKATSSVEVQQCLDLVIDPSFLP